MHLVKVVVTCRRNVVVGSQRSVKLGFLIVDGLPCSVRVVMSQLYQVSLVVVPTCINLRELPFGVSVQVLVAVLGEPKVPGHPSI